MGSGGDEKGFSGWRRHAHPFFWMVCLLLLLAGFAAFSVPSKAPGYALESSWLYRLEVGGAFFVGLLVVVLVLWLGYSGRSIGGLQLPGGGGVNLPHPDPDLDDAAEGLAGYKQKTDARLERLEDSIKLLTSEGKPK